jgi:AraC-like DNA-binding protein
MADALRDDCEHGRRTSLARLASEVNVSPQHASRAFTGKYAASPSRYRTEHRLRRALRLLGDGATPARAALESGFADQSHFTRAMKQLLGQTPHKWSKSPQC